MKSCPVFRIFLAAAVLLLDSFGAVAADQPVADVIVYNAKVITVNSNQPSAQAIAVLDGKILAVGRERQVLRHKGEDTRMIDAKGATVLPGLMDDRVNSYLAVINQLTTPQPPLHDIPEALAYIRQQAAAKKTNEWIQLHGIYPTRLKENRLPTKAELDAAAPNNPVDWNCGDVDLVNSKALEVSQITTSTRIPLDADVPLDEKRNFTGWMRNAWSLLKVPLPPPPPAAQKRAALRELFRLYNQQGITSITEHFATPGAIDIFRDLEKSNELTVRISCDRLIQPAATVEDSEKRLGELTNAGPDKLPYGPTGVGDDWVRIGHLHVRMDGEVASGTAYLRTPWGIGPTYQITQPAYRGETFQDPDMLAALFQTAAQQGWQLSGDCSGDAALDQLLNAYQKVQFKQDIRQRRFLISRAAFQAKENWERCLKLGLATDMQPVALYEDGDSLLKTIGDRRLREFLPWKAYFEFGLVAGAGSDHRLGLNPLDSINPFNPWLGIWDAVTRQTKDGAETHPEEKLSREQAIQIYTANNAWLTFDEKKKGTLEPGKLADLIMVDQDLLKCPEAEIRNTKVLLTMVDGKIVWEAK